ncbi:helix-turn-helix transcriptional regulator [Luteolibacter arcticus]|uniref:Helix-turn-helix transcriptional regulator n=1 Tax=Luteolibacter arcticus TaxID=1581411 RepID=A0ABT3GCD1_9BACT|nr:helix-turn-helix transcriptional regulator [Luteolibacter arcticus]MCW1921286.1 helix-turn-helix transcriptional regulator [Luteolibacter arcticus]
MNKSPNCSSIPGPSRFSTPKNMQVTAQVIEKIIRGMKDRGNMSQTALAEKLGVDRSYISKLLRGIYPTIPDAQAIKIGEILEIRLVKLRFVGGEVSSTALQLTQMAEEDAAFSSVLEALVLLKGGDAKKAFLPSVSTEALKVIGEEITRVVMRWEDHQDPHYAKIGAETLGFLRDFYQKGEF